jgi:Tfp pilus assembly protein PilO
MIEINLARQLQRSSKEIRQVPRGYGWVAVILILGIGVASWWWTHLQQQKYENILREKHILTQTFAKTHSTLSRLVEYQKEKQLLTETLEALERKKLTKKQPMALLDGVSQSVEGLEVWLDRVQMIDRVVELRGQSFVLKDIGKYIDALENHQVITSLPVVEIFDDKTGDNGQVFSFMIRFTLGDRVTT